MEVTQTNQHFAGRYERKYLVQEYRAQDIELLLRQHPAVFTEIYYPRVINNVYFDNYQWESYLDNINGVSQRFKIRLRWYSQKFLNFKKQDNLLSDEISVPHLEFKLKQGDLVQKHLVGIEDYRSHLPLALPQSIVDLIDRTKDKQTGLETEPGVDFPQSWMDKFLLYRPVLFNNYQRKYFLSADQKVRVTIDRQINFRDLIGSEINWSLSRFLPATIVEIKADWTDGERISQVAKFLPFKLSRCSKYVFGVSSCYPDLETPSSELSFRTVPDYDY